MTLPFAGAPPVGSMTITDVAFAGTVTVAVPPTGIVTDVGVPAGSQSMLSVTGSFPVYPISIFPPCRGGIGEIVMTGWGLSSGSWVDMPTSRAQTPRASLSMPAVSICQTLRLE